MRFQRLHVPAFGPFTDLDLRFTDQLGDLQVIYGPNEAGKSSLLRVIRDLLFGIPVQSADNFLHAYADLRIRGEICNRAGQQLVFQRRKGNKNTLLDAEGHQFPDSVLTQFLGGVDQAYFSAMFGLGAEELREGAQQLLRGEGDIGQALFSASIGGTPVQKVVQVLQEEADRIFKGRATASVSIRPAANRYKELIKQSREAMVNPETWDRNERELAEVEVVKKGLEEESARLDRDLQWIARCEDALPTVSRLSEVRQRLAQLPPLPDLASDFIPRVQTARLGVSESKAEVQRLTANIRELQTQLQSCHIAPSVLAEAESLDRLHQDLGAYRNHKRSLAELQATLGEIESLIRAGMLNLRLIGEFAALESYRLSSPIRLACEEAAGALKSALVGQAANAIEAEELINQIHTQEAQLQSLPETDLTALREALAVAAEATDADRSFSSSESEEQRLARETVDQHYLVPGAPEDFDATACLAVPSVATIRRYQEQIEGFQREIRGEEDRVRDANKRADAIRADLGRMQRQGELPSEDTLRNAREHRDRGWSLVLAEWKGSGAKEELIPGLPLEEAFPRAIVKADNIADQLRLHAEAVAQAEEKRFQLSEIERQVADRQKIQDQQDALRKCQESWRTEWSGCRITPSSPPEMQEWRDQWSEFRVRLGKLKAAQESLQKKRNQIQQARKLLAAVLGQSEEKEFSVLFAAAKRLVQDGEQSAGRRIEKTDQLAVLKGELAKIQQGRARLVEEANASTERWKSQCAAVGLSEDTSPDAGLTLLRERVDLLAKFDNWRASSNRSQSTAAAIALYEAAISEKAVALGFSSDTTEALESVLWMALTAARQSQTRHDQLAEQIQKASSELKNAEALVAQADQTLKDLIQLAGLTAVAELEPLLAHLEQRNSVQAQIDNLRNTLGGLARGQVVDEFVAQVRAENPDALAQRRATVEREKNEKELTLSGIREKLFQLGNEKKNLEKAGDAAAAFRQQAESCAATLRQDAARFLRLRLATHLLQSQIERFRKENQGPLLRKSGEVFQAITRGAFSGLGAEFNADDVPVLVGVRPDQAKVPVVGLSDGSRDQLFLALRLAALDRHLEEHGQGARRLPAARPSGDDPGRFLQAFDGQGCATTRG